MALKYVAGYNLYKDRAGEFRWNYVKNGNIIADSGEGYVNKSGAINGIAIMQATSGERYTDHT